MVHYLTRALKMFKNSTELTRLQDYRLHFTDAMRGIKQQLVGLKLSFTDRAMCAGVILLTKFLPSSFRR